MTHPRPGGAACGFLEQNAMRCGLGRIILYRGLVARCHSIDRGIRSRFQRGHDQGVYNSMTFLPMVAVALVVRAGWVRRTGRRQWRSRFFRSRSRQNSQLATRLGKFLRNPFIMATAKKSGAHAKIGERRWGNSNGVPFILAFTLFSDGAHAKTGDRRWEKSKRKPFILAIPPRKSGDHAKTGDLRPLWENSLRNPFILAIAKHARSDRRNDSD